MHNKAHDGEAVEKRGDLITFRGLKVCSAELGLTGQCDIVEFHRNSNGVTLMGYEGFWHPYPVEYKRGKSKLEDCDKLQLCAQAVCLEEMLCVKIDSGALYYGEPHKREKVTFTHELREELEDSVRTMHEMFKRQHTPKVKKKKSCQSCSIKDLCLPKLGELAKTSVKEYLEVHLE